MKGIAKDYWLYTFRNRIREEMDDSIESFNASFTVRQKDNDSDKDNHPIIEKEKSDINTEDALISLQSNQIENYEDILNQDKPNKRKYTKEEYETCLRQLQIHDDHLINSIIKIAMKSKPEIDPLELKMSVIKISQLPETEIAKIKSIPALIVTDARKSQELKGIKNNNKKTTSHSGSPDSDKYKDFYL
jgi:hypothetical protein